MRLTLGLGAAAVIAGLLAWWGWDKAWDAAAEVVSLKAEVKALNDQAELTDQAMLERDAEITRYQQAGTEARIRLRGIIHACTAPIDPVVSCMLNRASKGEGGDAVKACADMAGREKQDAS